MRILYIDIDSLRPDHLGCYGYHRHTSPHIDALAAAGVRFENCYVSNAPCLPSRTALWSGQFGFRTGVVGHGGSAAQPFIEGSRRGFRGALGETSWMSALGQAGYRTVTVSSFAARHSAWHWYAGYDEIYNPGLGGMDRADQVAPIALAWLAQNGRADDWFLHVNFWDPHTPYRTPLAYGEPFASEPLPAWYTEALRQRLWQGYGAHSPQEPHGYPHQEWYAPSYEDFPRVPEQLDSMENVRRWIDGYDTGIRYVDDYVGRLLEALEELGVLEETAIIVGADHGENQGELNVWGDHHTADHVTCRVPLIVRWPGGQARVDDALHYQFDCAATVIELAGGEVPENWDGRSFADAFRAGQTAGRDYLVLSQGAWTCQRSVRFNDDGQAYLCLRTFHAGHKALEDLMLFNLTQDPREEENLAPTRPALMDRAMGHLAAWRHNMMVRSYTDVDPLMTVLREGGPEHTRGQLAPYLEHLRRTGRPHHAERLARQYPQEL
ncbi:MAG TPA: sulfatase-like hydrolase/transferase [Anaerolineae bacterium]